METDTQISRERLKWKRNREKEKGELWQVRLTKKMVARNTWSRKMIKDGNVKKWCLVSEGGFEMWMQHRDGPVVWSRRQQGESWKTLDVNSREHVGMGGRVIHSRGVFKMHLKDGCWRWLEVFRVLASLIHRAAGKVCGLSQSSNQCAVPEVHKRPQLPRYY